MNKKLLKLIHLYKDMTEEEYRKFPATSQSYLKKFGISIDEANTPFDGSNATDFGTMFHEALLEPELFKNKYFVLPEKPKFGTKAETGKTIKEQEAVWFAEVMKCNENKTAIKKSQYEMIKIMTSNVFKHPDLVAHKLLEMGSFSEVERPLFGTIRGLKMKGKADLIHWDRRLIVDIKTTKEKTMEGFIRSVGKYMYYVQEVIYTTLATIEYNNITGENIQNFNFVFVGVQNTAPHHVYVYSIPRIAFTQTGTSDFKNAKEITKRLIEKCKKYLNEPESIYAGNNGKWVKDMPIGKWNFPEILIEDAVVEPVNVPEIPQIEIIQEKLKHNAEKVAEEQAKENVKKAVIKKKEIESKAKTEPALYPEDRKKIIKAIEKRALKVEGYNANHLHNLKLLCFPDLFKTHQEVEETELTIEQLEKLEKFIEAKISSQKTAKNNENKVEIVENSEIEKIKENAKKALGGMYVRNLINMINDATDGNKNSIADLEDLNHEQLEVIKHKINVAADNREIKIEWDKRENND